MAARRSINSCKEILLNRMMAFLCIDSDKHGEGCKDLHWGISSDKLRVENWVVMENNIIVNAKILIISRMFTHIPTKGAKANGNHTRMNQIFWVILSILHSGFSECIPKFTVKTLTTSTSPTWLVFPRQKNQVVMKEYIKFVTLHAKTRLIKHGNLGETGFQTGFQRVSNS